VSASTVIIALAIGVGSGVVSGLLGVGGGVFMVPGMVLFLDMTQHAAEGTSLLVIIPTALVGAFTLWRRGYVMVGMAAILGAGGIAGALIGVRLPDHHRCAHGRPDAPRGTLGRCLTGCSDAAAPCSERTAWWPARIRRCRSPARPR
jgi:uncharacterized protein